MAHWRILRGLCVDKNARLIKASDRVKDDERQPGFFYGGDVIESDSDLSRFPDRYEKLDEQEFDGLDDMTVQQLKAFAAENGIDDLPEPLRKAQIVKAIRAQLAYREAVA
jgi:hypothetical protein